MTSIIKIQTKHLNEHSTLYGGQLLEWIDNYCLAKTERYRKKEGDKFFTRAMNCEFISPVYLGDMIQLKTINEDIKNNSIEFKFEIISNKKIIAKGKTTFVKIYNHKKSKI